MIRFLFFTDTHVRGNSPSSRLDDFPKTIIRKIKYIGELGRQLEVDGYIHGGDWLDRPDVSYSILSELVQALEEFKKPIYSVLGNHDIYGYNPSTYERTALSVLGACKFITRLSKTPIIIEKDGTKVSLTGRDSDFELDKNGNIEHYVNIADVPGAVKINTIHGFLCKNEWPNVPCTTIDSILHTPADITLTGHEHSGFEVVERNGKLFCNMGALARVSCSVGDVNREVKVALITVDGSRFKIDLIPLPIDIARPANEVLDRDKLLQEKEHQKQLETFMHNLNDLKLENMRTINIYTVLDNIAKLEQIETEVIDIIRERLQKAEEEIKKED